MSQKRPLEGVRVLNLGGIWAGRVASMLLADQGAEVIELNHPDRTEQMQDAFLARGKIVVSADLKDPAGYRTCLRLAEDADIVIDNLGAGRAAKFGLDFPSIQKLNASIVYISIPGFAKGSEWDGVAAFEAAIAASVGVYTDLHALGPLLGGPPIFTSVPMASAYGGVHAAIAATAAFLERIKTGVGGFVEVPLADALMSAMALLIMKVEGQPQRFDLPPVDKAMTEVAFPIIRQFSGMITEESRSSIKTYLAKFGRPQFGIHVCGDGKMVFINAVDHVHHARACLETLGILSDLIAEGALVGSPYEENGAGNNLSYSAGLSGKWSERLRTLMSQRFATRPAHEWEYLLQRAGVPVTVVHTTQEWLNLPMANAGGNVTELEDKKFGRVKQAGRYVSIAGPNAVSGPLQPRVAGANDIVWKSIRAAATITSKKDKNGKPLSGVRVLDLSNVIAGPAAGRVLAELGASVTRIDAPAPTAGPRMTMWFGIDVNQGKRAVILDLKSKDGRAIFNKMVREADVVLHNFLDNSTVKLGISDAQLRKINPDIITCQVSAWGGPDHGPFKDFPAFDPVLQAATGIMSRYGKPEAPVLHGIASCVDYISGFLAALGMAQALVARELGRGGSYVRTSLSMGAQLVQFPFVLAAEGSKVSEISTQTTLGCGPHYRLYKAQDGWVFLASRPSELNMIAQRLGAEPTEAGLEQAFADRPAAKLAGLIAGLTAALVPVRRLDELREACTVTEQPGRGLNRTALAMRKADHPSGYQVSLPIPTWYRFEGKVSEALSPSPFPGTHTSQVLREHGVSEAELTDLISKNVARENWAVLKHYLPL